jgi:hypothetical protein
LSKIFAASADSSGKVTVGGVQIPEAVILSEGKAASSGLLILEGGTCWYVPTDVSDLKTTIGKVIDVITDIVSSLNSVNTALTSLSAVPVGAWTPPPTLATSVTSITTQVTDLTAIKTALNTLKGALI